MRPGGEDPGEEPAQRPTQGGPTNRSHDGSHTPTPLHRTTAFTCRAGCKERDVSEDRNAGPVKCNALLCRDPALNRRVFGWSRHNLPWLRTTMCQGVALATYL